jgi:GWxTD domain-containing protein
MVIVLSCRTTQPVIDTKDLSHIYNPTRAFFTPSYAVNTFSDESAALSVRFLANNMFFSEANPAGVPTAVISINTKLYKIMQGARILMDTTTYDLSIVRDPQRMEYLFSIPFKTEGNSQYLVEIKTLDRLRTITTQTFMPFNTLNQFNSYNFSIRDYFTGGRLFSRAISVDEYINLLYTRGHLDSIYISYFRPFDRTPDPPYMMLPQRQIDYEPDTTIAIAYSDTLPIMLPRKGIYLNSANREVKNGYALFNFGESYPIMITPEDMIDPLSYIANRDEIDQIKANSNLKIALDNFWIKCGGGNIEKARELIRIYYNRVVYANIYFTSFTEGWRTERGMIYVIYGPPDKVYKSLDGEEWGYRRQTVKSSWGGRYNVTEDYLFFTFKQRDNIFSDNDYFLSRSDALITQWDKAVLNWREGIIFRFDNPTGF